jgi:hypothetical protein
MQPFRGFAAGQRCSRHTLVYGYLPAWATNAHERDAARVGLALVLVDGARLK